MKLQANKKTKVKIKNPSMGFFVLTFIILILNYASISLFNNVRGIDMKEFADNRNRFSTTLNAKRGTIYDYKENILAQNVTSYTVIAILSSDATEDNDNPRHVVDKVKTATLLSPLINMTYDEILNLLNTEDAYQVELGPGGRDITGLVKDEIERLELPGIDFIESSKRFYPNGDFASYIIGYAKNVTNKENSEESIEGELGIEYLFNKELKGTDGFLEYEQDLNGYKLPNTKEIRSEAIDGNDIYLTIDSNIQRFVDDALNVSYNKYKPEWILLYVMDAKTGDILAGSSYPSFDPNTRELVNYQNPLVSYEYEPGSVMKTFTYMCAVDKSNYNGNDTFLSGSFKLPDGTIIYDVVRSGWGTISLDEGYKRSSNVGVANLLTKYIDREELYNCFDKFGFGKKSNIKLPSEETGNINFTYTYDTISAGFGQGIYTTPIQQLQGLTILSNNGKMIYPNIVKKIVDYNGNVTFERKVTETNQLIKESTADYVLDLMGKTYSSAYQIDGYDIAGKTGTAEVYDSNLGTYYSGANIYSFSSIYPKEDPKVIIYTSAKFSKNGAHSATSEAFKSIIKSIAKYYNINEVIETLKSYNVESYISKKTTDIVNLLDKEKIKNIVIGNGKYIVNQFPKVNSSVIENDKVFLLTNYTKLYMPDMINWSRLDVVTFSNLTDIDITIEGSGYVTSQSILSGIEINGKSKIKVILE